MSDVPDLTRTWQYYVNFYRRLSQSSGWPNQVAMLEFVERVAPAAIAENIVPGTSLYILHLSYEYRGHSPTVSIWGGGYYQQTKAPFSVSWSGRLNEAEPFECIDDALWQRIVARLKGS